MDTVLTIAIVAVYLLSGATITAGMYFETRQRGHFRPRQPQWLFAALTIAVGAFIMVPMASFWWLLSVGEGFAE